MSLGAMVLARGADGIDLGLWLRRVLGTFASVPGLVLGHTLRSMTATDEALSEVIRPWLCLVIPDDEDAVGRMTRLAMSFRAQGATVEETCQWTSVLMRNWIRAFFQCVAPPEPQTVGG